MTSIRLHKQGESIIVTIPASEAKNLDMDKGYSVKVDEKGVITIVPILNNPFTGASEGEFYEPDIWSDMKPAGRES